MANDNPPIDKSPSRIRRMFEEISPRYDFLNHFLSAGIDVAWRRRTVRSVAPVEGAGPVLDLCTGTGDLAIAYWKKARRRVPVFGVDFAHPMLKIANAKRERLLAGRRHKPDFPQKPGFSEKPGFSSTAGGHPEADASGSPAPAELLFFEADALRLPFADGSFQIVSVAFGLRNVADTEGGLREMVRVCRPGGRVAVLEFSLPRNRLVRGLYGFYFRRVLPRIGRLLAPGRSAAYNYLPASVGEFPQGDDLAAMMAACGLSDVAYRPLTCGIATLYSGVVSGQWSVVR